VLNLQQVCERGTDLLWELVNKATCGLNLKNLRGEAILGESMLRDRMW
jgi:hypothetical protein